MQGRRDNDRFKRTALALTSGFSCGFWSAKNIRRGWGPGENPANAIPLTFAVAYFLNNRNCDIAFLSMMGACLGVVAESFSARSVNDPSPYQKPEP